MAGRDQHVPKKGPCLCSKRKVDFPRAAVHTPPVGMGRLHITPDSMVLPLVLILKRFLSLILGFFLSVVSLKKLKN